MNSLADLYPAAIGRQHPYGNLQPLPGLVDDRHRAISPLRLAKDLNGGPIERVKRIEDLDLSVFRAQGIVGVGVCILISTASFPPAVSIQATLAGFILSIPSSSPSRSLVASFAASFLISFNAYPISLDPTSLPPSCTRCYSMIGWSMPSPLLADLLMSCAISAAIHTASPSAISACSASMVTA